MFIDELIKVLRKSEEDIDPLLKKGVCESVQTLVEKITANDQRYLLDGIVARAFDDRE